MTRISAKNADRARPRPGAIGFARLAALALFLLAAGLMPLPDAAFGQGTGQALAQGGGPDGAEFKQSLAQWEASLAEIETEIKASNLEADQIVRLRTRAEAARDGARTSKAEAEARAAEIKQLLDSLGPKPKEGEPAEAEDVAKRRAEIEAQLAEAEGRIKQAELIATRAEALIAQLAGARRAGIADNLSKVGPPIFSAATWEKAVPEFGGWLAKIVNAPAEWWRSGAVGEIKGSPRAILGLLAVLAALILGILFKRWLLRRFGRDKRISEPDFPRRFVAAGVEGFARGMLPVVLVWSSYVVLNALGLLLGSFGEVLQGLAVAVSIYFLITGLTRAALAPQAPHWRIKEFGDRAARLLNRRIAILAGLLAVQTFLVWPGRTLEPSPELIAAIGFLFRTAMSVVVLSLLDPRLWYSAQEETAHGVAAEGSRPKPAPGAVPAGAGAKKQTEAHKGFHVHRYWWVRALVGAVAIAVPVASLMGYHELSRFLATRLVLISALIGIYLLIREFVRDMTDVMLDPDKGFGTRTRAALGVGEQGAGMLRFWLILVVDLILFGCAGLLLLLLLGLDWRELSDSFGQAMSGFAIGGQKISPRDILLALGVFIVLFVVVRVFQRFLETQVWPNTRLDIGVRTAIKAGVGYLGITAAALFAITAAGFDLSNLAIIAGALSVGIGFGLQNIVNNFVSGIILLIGRPIKVGDWVIAGTNEGIVKKINVRSTEIETFQLASVIVPNSELISNSVTNWTHVDSRVRVEVRVGVAYGSDTDLVHELLLRCAAEHEGVLDWPEPFVVFLDFGASSLDFELRCYVGRAFEKVSTASDLRFSINRIFAEEKISIPFPQQDMHIKDLDRLERLLGRPGASRKTEPDGDENDRPSAGRKRREGPRGAETDGGDD